jgi:UDP-arabinose 4-epimerase
MKNVLVTGGAGYIGSHTCKALAQQGYQPIVYDNLIYGHPWAVKWGSLEVGDIQDYRRLSQVVRQYQPIATIHFAAFAYVGESVADPAKYYRNNVSGTLNLIECLKDHNLNHLIFSSTCATYGVPKKIPIREDHQQVPINPYGQSKLMIEKILQDFSNAYGFKSVALRYFNAAGADSDCDIGEQHDPETHAIPLILDAIQNSEKPFTVFGTDYDTPDGTCIRDYIHVSDLAQAHVLALQYLQNDGETTAYNLGNGEGYSVKELINAAERITAKKVKARLGERRPGDPDRLVGDANKIKKELGWTPQFANLEEIIETAWKWHQRNQ